MPTPCKPIVAHTSHVAIPHICHFFTQAKFWENKICTEKRVNYDKLHSKLPILHVNYDKLHSKLPILRVNYDKLQSKLPIFRVKSVKIYTRQKKIYTSANRGARDKYEVSLRLLLTTINRSLLLNIAQLLILVITITTSSGVLFRCASIS